MKGQFNQVGSILKLILRRDRLRISLWVLGFWVVTILTAVAFEDLYPTDSDRQEIAVTMENPAITALIGKGYGLDNYTEGAMMAHQMLAFTLLFVAVMSVLLVIRHTRSEEEEGRVELIRALPTGRLANLAATIVVMVITYFVLAILIGFSLFALGIDSMDLNGSLLYGIAMGVTGIFFAATTALCAQLSETSRGAIGLSFLIVGVSYLIRAVGDVSNETLSWLSPFGWVLASEVYVNNYWWTIGLTLVVSLVILFFAFYLNSIRDLGAGFLPTRGGKRHASAFTKNQLGLTIRLQKTSIISWAVVLFVFGATYGSVLGDTDTYFAEIEMMKEVMAIQDGIPMSLQFVTMVSSIMAVLSTIPVIMSLNKLKKEEKRNRTEQVLATAMSRIKFLGSYLITSLLVSLIMLGSSAVGLALAGAQTMDEETASFMELMNAVMVYLPAVWLMVGVAAVFIGLGRLNGVTYAYLGFVFVVIYFGGVLQFSDTVKNLSPFEHIPAIPVDDFQFWILFSLTIIAVVLMMIGLVFYRRRDIKG
ncbi:ABC transporter permease [Aquisalibacillus elongatus]|uniref:ABC-2 type transport system permease protein n=1 Tax=Aquisalibacillus elongatus TaxID=485577 RepID=A0A3N5B8S9_9BACI|nr:ABC transporter permease [Aquisalibacillus elongatus]RPF53389.1 ABC-2 type transport system permease protein [Aquisalibacillus elongatus]